MKWFKHNSSANMDAKLQEIMLDYGLEGYGLYWYCLELIAGNVEQDNLTFELEHDCRVIARNTGSTVQRVQEMMTKFIELNLFENNQGRVTCLKLSKMSDDYTAKLVRKKEPQALDSIEVRQTPTNSEKDPLDKIRIDKNRLDKNIKDKNKNTPQVCPKVSEVFDFWKTTMGKTRSKLTDAVRSKIQARLDEGFSPDELLSAITGCAQSSFHMGNNPEGSLHNSIDLIFRNSNKTEFFIEKNLDPQRRASHENSQDNARKPASGGVTAGDVFSFGETDRREFSNEVRGADLREVNSGLRDGFHQPVSGYKTLEHEPTGMGAGDQGRVVDGCNDENGNRQPENTNRQAREAQPISAESDGVYWDVPAAEPVGFVESSRSEECAAQSMHDAEPVE